MIYANSDNFEEIIKGEVVVVDFFAKWCGPCKMLSPVLEKISEKYKDISFVKVDIDESLDLAEKYSIMSVPTIVLFKNGNIIGVTQGFQSEISLSNWIEKLR